MSNAGLKSNSRIKEVVLNKDLFPIKLEGNDKKLLSVTFMYDGSNEKNLVRIFFESNDDRFKSFVINKDLITRFLSFKRADEKAMEILRKKSIDDRNIISLKKYAFECLQYIE